MHLPDGFIDGKTAATAAAISFVGVGLALRQVRNELPPRRVPLLGLSAAFLFTAQMVNFPVVSGTSGHLVGGVLVAALLGPSAAVVVVTAVLIVQCFLFADGGVLALGANVFNMGILGAAGGYAVYRLIRGWLPDRRGQTAAIAFAGWSSVVLAAISCAGQLAWSGTVKWSIGFAAMTGTHTLIGLGEGLISSLAFLAIQRTRPELILEDSQEEKPSRRSELVPFGILVVLGLAVFVAPFACPWPDGLESVAARLGFEHAATEPLFAAPAPDYQAPGIRWTVAATAVAGVVGTLVVFMLAITLGKLLVPGRKDTPVGISPSHD